MIKEHARDVDVSEWPLRWPQVRVDQFSNIDMMRVKVLDALNSLCDEAETRHGWTHRINSDYRGDARPTSQHRKGNAVDVVFYLDSPGDVPVIDQYILSVGYGKFRRVGFYPFWNSPGLHLDMKDQTLYWWRDNDNDYHYSKTPSGLLTWRTA